MPSYFKGFVDSSSLFMSIKNDFLLIDGKRDVVDRLDNVGLRECGPNRGDESEDQDHR